MTTTSSPFASVKSEIRADSSGAFAKATGIDAVASAVPRTKATMARRAHRAIPMSSIMKSFPGIRAGNLPAGTAQKK
jgi:hypothetical protein